MLYGDGLRTYTTHTGEAIGFCFNKEFQNKSKIDHNTSQTADISCTTSFSFLFVSQQFSWELIEFQLDSGVNIFYQHILEQLYTNILLEPPQTQFRIV